MIDTDKYEGHTPGPWVISVEPSDHAPRGEDLLITSIHQHGNKECVNELDDDVCVVEMVYGGNDRLRVKEDAQLIADAPLLLAEVERLREDNKKLHDAINGCAYRGSEGSALDLYCESIIERCPTCYQNIDDMECGCEEE